MTIDAVELDRGGAWGGGRLAGIAARRSITVVFWLLLVAFALAPLLGILSTAFSKSGFWQFPPHDLSLTWFRQFWQDAQLRNAFFVSLEAAVVASLVGAVVSLLVAVAASRRVRMGGRSRPRWALLVLIPLLVPPLGLGLGIRELYGNAHIPINAFTIGLAQVILIVPLTAGLLTVALEAVPVTLERAAASVGAPPRYVLLHVIMPTIRGALIAAVILGFIRSFDDAAVALFLNASNAVTLPVVLLFNFSETGVSNGLVAAAGSSLLFVGLIAAAVLHSTVGISKVFGVPGGASAGRELQSLRSGGSV
jgi:putative spermidine/putrescine transport system permease protein